MLGSLQQDAILQNQTFQHSLYLQAEEPPTRPARYPEEKPRTRIPRASESETERDRESERETQRQTDREKESGIDTQTGRQIDRVGR